jgi:WD40 repeat protein
MRSKIRHLSVAAHGDVFASAEFEKVVHIYRPGVASVQRTIYTNLCFGGHRLQIVPSRDVLLAGAYQMHGIEGYSLSSGRRIWQRRELTKVQHIRRNPADDTISCFFDDQAGLVIDPASGASVTSYRGVKDVFFSEDGIYRLDEARPLYRLFQKDNIAFKIKSESFSILDAAFSPDYLAVSEAGGAVRLFSFDSGKCISRYMPPPGYHVLRIVYSPTLRCFAGLLWGYKSNADYFIVHVSPDGDELLRFQVFDGYESAFLRNRDSILLASGQEIDLRTGREVFAYAFPMDKTEN